MKRLFLSATIIAANAVAMPAYSQGNQSITPDQIQLNQQLTTPQQPLQILQQHQGVSNSSLKGLIDDMKGMVRDMVKVDTTTGDPKVHVKAPFVNVDLEHGQPNVNVNAPFVHVTKSGGNPVSVNAPFTKIGDRDSASQGNSGAPADRGNVHIKAPFVNVDNSAGTNVNVHAPFANINSTPGGTQVQAPFTNVGGSGTPGQAPPNFDPNSGASNPAP